MAHAQFVGELLLSTAADERDSAVAGVLLRLLPGPWRLLGTLTAASETGNGQTCCLCESEGVAGDLPERLGADVLICVPGSVQCNAVQ